MSFFIFLVRLKAEQEDGDATPPAGGVASARARSLPGGSVAVEGFTDLAVNGLKFSGNAQRRKRRCLLFQGTFLLDLDFYLVEKLFRPPSRQPAYRANRSHAEFLTRLDCPASAIKAALQKVWNAQEPLEVIPGAAISQLV